MKNFWREILRFLAKKANSIQVLSSLLAIVFGMLFGLLVMLIVNPADAFPGFFTILTGPFQAGMRSFGNMFYRATPIIFTGLSVAFAFRTGLFNIGATGQFTIGAYIAVYIGVHWGFLGPFHWAVAIFFALIGGGLWGALPGLLKAFRNVHEVVSSIMLNYVAMYLMILMVKRTVFFGDHARSLAIQDSAELPKWFLGSIFPGSSINIGIFIAILFVAVIHIILNKTTFGYELKSVGFNKDAAKYSGMNEKRNIVLSMAIAGAIAGAGGAVFFLVGGRYLHVNAVLMQQGFTGIAVALLGLSAPIGVLLAGIFYGFLELGGLFLQGFDFTSEIIDIIIAVIIYFSALSLFLQKFVASYIKRKTEEDVEIAEGADIK